MPEPSPFMMLSRWQWWVMVALHVFFLIAGQAAAVLLGKLYYDHGGNSTWLATVVQTAGFPILFLPFLFLPRAKDNQACSSSSSGSGSGSGSTSLKVIAIIYFVLGAVLAGDNMLYSTGLLYLSSSTYSLICATQLAFNAVFSYFINSQKFTALILNSVAVLTLSAALIAVSDDSEGPSGISKSRYLIGFFCTLGASALYSLLLSLMQATFQKVLKKETFSVVLEMQIYTSLVATCMSVVGLFASGEWRTLHQEMDGFGKGRGSYVQTLAWTAVCWQVCSVGVVGLIFLVSSLFSNVISTMSLAVTPIASLTVFHDKMNGAKIIALLLALLGFTSYIYQNYTDEKEVRKSQEYGDSHESTSC